MTIDGDYRIEAGLDEGQVYKVNGIASAIKWV